MFSAALQRRNTDTPNIWSTDSRVQSACFSKYLGTGLVKDCELKSVFNCTVIDFDIGLYTINKLNERLFRVEPCVTQLY